MSEREAVKARQSSPADLMRHALGVQYYPAVRRWSKPRRNYFVAGEADEAAWRSLVEQGMARCIAEGNELTDGCPVFVVTDVGRANALDGITFKRRWGYREKVNR